MNHDLMIRMTGIDYDITYDPGIVSLAECSISLREPFWVVAWKIDDPIWAVHTTNNAYISETDNDAREGLYSFCPDTKSWIWGVAPFITKYEAIYLRDRIVRLTSEMGIELVKQEISIKLPDMV